MPALYLIQFTEKKKFRFHPVVFLLQLKDHLGKTVYSHSFIYVFIYLFILFKEHLLNARHVFVNKSWVDNI